MRVHFTGLFHSLGRLLQPSELHMVPRVVSPASSGGCISASALGCEVFCSPHIRGSALLLDSCPSLVVAVFVVLLILLVISILCSLSAIATGSSDKSATPNLSLPVSYPCSEVV